MRSVSSVATFCVLASGVGAYATEPTDLGTGIAQLEALDSACPRYRINWNDTFGVNFRDREQRTALLETLRNPQFLEAYDFEQKRLALVTPSHPWVACADLIEMIGMEDLLPE